MKLGDFIICPRCGKVCARWCEGYIEEAKGKKRIRYYGVVAVAVECECGNKFDVPGKIGIKEV